LKTRYVVRSIYFPFSCPENAPDPGFGFAERSAKGAPSCDYTWRNGSRDGALLHKSSPNNDVLKGRAGASSSSGVPSLLSLHRNSYFRPHLGILAAPLPQSEGRDSLISFVPRFAVLVIGLCSQKDMFVFPEPFNSPVRFSSSVDCFSHLSITTKYFWC